MRWVRERAYVVQHLPKVPPVNPPTTPAPNKMLSFIGWISTDAPTNVSPTRDVIQRRHFRQDSVSLGHADFLVSQLKTSSCTILSLYYIDTVLERSIGT